MGVAIAIEIGTVFRGREDGIVAIIHRGGYGARDDWLWLVILGLGERSGKDKQTGRRSDPGCSKGNSFHIKTDKKKMKEFLGRIRRQKAIESVAKVQLF